jgi:biotin carboxyl carrier protein
MEAMKMQNELRSPRSGQVARLAVQEGQAVATHQLLLTLA